MKNEMIFFNLASSIKNSYLIWLLYNWTQDDVLINFHKNYVFFKFPFFQKKWPFFSRAWSLEISRGRLARQAPAFGWGAQRGPRSTRDAVNAGHSQRGMQSTRDAVDAGRCQRGTLAMRVTVKADGCQGRGDITVGNHHCKKQMGISFRLWTQGLVIMRWALIMQLKATTIVTLTM